MNIYFLNATFHHNVFACQSRQTDKHLLNRTKAAVNHKRIFFLRFDENGNMDFGGKKRHLEIKIAVIKKKVLKLNKTIVEK